jgi:fatty-acyl-CoA synthase
LYDFVPVLEGLKQQLPNVKTLILMSDRAVPQTGGLTFAGEYEAPLVGASPDYKFPDFDENALATTFYTTGTAGSPKGVYFSHRQLVLHSLAEMAFFGTAAKQGRFCRDHVYMPITPMFHSHAWGLPWMATLSGVKHVYPGRYDPALLVKLIKTEGVTFTHCVPTILQMLLCDGTRSAGNLVSSAPMATSSLLQKLHVEKPTSFDPKEWLRMVLVAAQLSKAPASVTRISCSFYA